MRMVATVPTVKRRGLCAMVRVRIQIRYGALIMPFCSFLLTPDAAKRQMDEEERGVLLAFV